MDTSGVVVVTGAASGMGTAVARRLLRPDRVLVLVDVDEDRLEAARDELAAHAGGDEAIHIARVDVSDEVGVGDLAARVASYGPLATLAHAAGISSRMADWRTVMRVDLVGTAILLDAFRPHAEEGSVAVCWSSAAAYMSPAAQGDSTIDALLDEPRAADLLDRLEAVNGERFNAPDGTNDGYAWAKRGVIRLVRREAAAWGQRGARIVSVSPGIVNTPMARLSLEAWPDMQLMIDSTPSSRMGTPSEIAELVAFLASPDAAFITGTDILIDGGLAAGLAHHV